MEIRGLVSPGELPEVVRDFYRVCEKKGAKADYKGNGLFVAVKEEVQVTLTIGAYHQSMPSKMLVDALMEVMEEAF
ncbi:MAG: hypothetical protein J6W09_02710 [Bacteroidales bacterium]|nr:hypothetical protein [Bacteroidales bacterium]